MHQRTIDRDPGFRTPTIADTQTLTDGDIVARLAAQSADDIEFIGKAFAHLSAVLFSISERIIGWENADDAFEGVTRTATTPEAA